jgi:hypothetical protein
MNYDGLSPAHSLHSFETRRMQRRGLSPAIARARGGRGDEINNLSDSLRGGITRNVPSAVGGKCLWPMDLPSRKLNGKSVVGRYDEDLPRERDSTLIRFALSANLIKKLCVL